MSLSERTVSTTPESASATSNASPRRESPSPDAQTGVLALLVEDGSAVPAHGEHKRTFLARLRVDLEQMAAQETAGTPFAGRACPWIPYHLNRYESRPVAASHRLLRHYAGPGPHRSLAEVRRAVVEHARRQVRQWWATGAIPGIVRVEAMIVRSDSLHLISTAPSSLGAVPHQRMVYALGSMAITPTTAVLLPPDWIGTARAGSGVVHLNVTPDPANPGRKRIPTQLDEVAQYAVHESVHALDAPAAGSDPFDNYQSEFRAYWADGRYSNLSTDIDPSLTPGPKSPLANQIFRHIYDLYTDIREAYEANTMGMRERVDNYLYPDALNLVMSRELENLRGAIVNTAPPYATRKANVTAMYALCSSTDTDEITGNRQWRDLVEQHFTGTVTLPTGGTELEANEIKDLLSIPRPTP